MLYINNTIKLYNGDCMEYMRLLPDKSIDAVITDPPYGIADVWKGSGCSGWGNAKAQSEKRNVWDAQAPAQEVFDEIFRVSKAQIIWGGNYFNLPRSRGWLVWNKPERGFTLSEAELAWTSFDMPMRVFDCRRSDINRKHPTQKPISLMNWCMTFFKSGITVLDPFMGSGTTGVAAINARCDFIGCEIDDEYYDIAKERLEEAQHQMQLPFHIT